jgi:cation diffusion facilitator CzcD-associated flavoprotein CzcO
MTSRPINFCEVAIVGAGPYGLSIAAHLDQSGVKTCVFGAPMGFWRENMPKGMKLRSPWHGTHLASPNHAHSLDAYARDHNIDDDRLLPLEDFIDYGEWFQKRAVPQLDDRTVRLVDAGSNGFTLTLRDGETISADRVVVATGLRNQDYRPPLFAGLSKDVVSHTCDHADLSIFGGKRVAVVGRGQSACESAALLSEAGAAAELISRGDIRWLDNLTDGGAKSSLRRLRQALDAPSAVGPFPLSWLAEFPGLTRHLPKNLREEFSRRCLKPAAAGWLKPRFANVSCNTGRIITGVRATTAGIVLELDNGARTFDHVLLGTGYRVDIARLGILSRRILDKIACDGGAPLLGTGFESTVAKLHFVGSYAVRSYGPLLRFIAGAPFTAYAVTKAALADTASVGREFLSSADSEFGAAAHNLSQPQ